MLKRILEILKSIKSIKSSNKGTLLYPGLEYIAESLGYESNDKLISEFLGNEYTVRMEDYDEYGLPINDNYNLLYTRWKVYLYDKFPWLSCGKQFEMQRFFSKYKRIQMKEF